MPLVQEDAIRNSQQHRISESDNSEPTYYMVKFQYPIKKGMKREIMRLSKDNMVRYLPHDVYIVSMLPSAADKISGLDGVTGVYYLPSGRRQFLVQISCEFIVTLSYSDKDDEQMSKCLQHSTGSWKRGVRDRSLF